MAWSKNFNNPNLLKNHQQFNRSYGPGTHAREFDVFGTGLTVAMGAPLAVEFVAVPILEASIEAAVVSKATIIESLLAAEYNTSNVSFVINSPYLVGTFLRHTQTGRIILAVIMSQLPEGMVGTFQGDELTEFMIKYVEELTNSPEAKEWIKRKNEMGHK